MKDYGHLESFKKGMRKFGYGYLSLGIVALILAAFLPENNVQLMFLVVLGVCSSVMGIRRLVEFRKTNGG